MGQQPNIELDDSDRPRRDLERGVERRWVPNRPGEISGPDEVPTGPSFGRPGPDTGWALRILTRTSYDRGDRPDELAALLTSLIGARAAAVGRGPVPQDAEVALSLLGLRPQDMGDAALEHLATRRRQWLDSIAHEASPGMAALDSIPPSLLAESPSGVRARLSAEPTLVG